jgi:hypothetical protein
MAENTSRQQWIDRYVREELTVEEITEFEEALMESSVMQSELEAVLGLREALLHEPDVIAQKPTGHSALLLDIELNSVSRQQQALDFTLVDEAGAVVLSWNAAVGPDGHVDALLNSEEVPASRLRLDISAEDGQVLDQRLLEFR